MMTERVRPLTYAQAKRCETAKEARCVCRCGGALHGARRGDVLTLPFDDPHSPTTPCKRCGGEGYVILRYLYGSYDSPEGKQPCPKCKGTGKVYVQSALKVVKERARQTAKGMV